MKNSLESLIRALPKAELHVHLEGSMTPEFVYELACRNGHPFMDMDLDYVETLYQHRNFHDFLEHFGAIIEVLQQPSDLFQLVLHYTGRAKGNNIVYAELHLTPLCLVGSRMPYPLMMEAIERGIAEARGQGVELKIILDSVRQWGADHVAQTLNQHRLHPSRSVVGFGIGGDETAFLAEEFAEVFSQARQLGLHTVAHSGEAAGADSMRDTLKHLVPERILHGIRAVEDPQLMSLLAEKQIPLDVCPSSNVATGVVSSLADHPVRKMIDAGLRVTINTDDPGLFKSDLNPELLTLAETLNLSPETTVQLVKEGFAAAFTAEDRKAQYIEAVERTWAIFQQEEL